MLIISLIPWLNYKGIFWNHTRNIFEDLNTHFHFHIKYQFIIWKSIWFWICDMECFLTYLQIFYVMATKLKFSNQWIFFKWRRKVVLLYFEFWIKNSESWCYLKRNVILYYTTFLKITFFEGNTDALVLLFYYFLCMEKC